MQLMDKSKVTGRQGKAERIALTKYLTFLIFVFFVSSRFYSAHNARIASAVLATAIPSVCLSVTRRYCVKTTARSTVQFAPLDSKMCLVL